MQNLNRRRFGKLVMGAAAGLPLAAAAASVAQAAPVAAAASADPASPLTSAQMEQFQKTLPDTAAELKKLHGFELGYGYEPDFIFRATGAAPSTKKAKGKAGKPGRKVVKHG